MESVWIYAAIDPKGEPAPHVGLWARETEESAQEAVDALNQRDSWLCQGGFRARLLGEFVPKGGA